MGLPDEVPVSPFFVYRGEIDRFEGVLYRDVKGVCGDVFIE